MSGSRNIARLTPSNSGLLPNSNINAFNIGQIPFPASQNKSTNPNTLDDYEEGTWTAQILGTGSNPTYTTTYTNVSKYTKIGNIVLFSGSLRFENYSGGSGTFGISLPFTLQNIPGFWQAVGILGHSGNGFT